MTVYEAFVHLCVAMHARIVIETLRLQGTSLHHPLPDTAARLARCRLGNIPEGQCRNLTLYVDAVHQRPRNLVEITVYLPG